MTKRTKTALLAFSVTLAGNAWALSPPNITTDIPWTDTGGVYQLPSTSDATFNGVTDIKAAFDNARRQEESQRGLPANTLGVLNLPSQADWDKMTDDAKGLLILNDERIDRVDIGANIQEHGFAGIESHIDNIAKNYGDLLHDTDTTGHNQDGFGPVARIDQDADIGVDALGSGSDCHEFLPRAENLAYFATTGSSIPLPLERAIYNWIYADANSGWGHREAVLLQNVALDGGSGYTDNYGMDHAEGFLGIYVRSSPDYQPFASFPSNYGSVVVMNIFDPVSSPTACHYNVTLDDLSVGGAEGKVPTLDVPANTWVQIGLNTVPATGNTVQAILGDDVSGIYGTNWAVYRYDNTVTPNAYVELTPTDTMSPGVGYWFIHVSGAVTLDMPGSSSGVYVTHTAACTSVEGCYEVPLQAGSSAQWQMIGYPFRDNRDMDKVRIVTNNSGSCAAGCTLSAASSLMGTTWWHYSASINDYQQLTSGGANPLKPWDGLWVSILPTAAGTDLKVLLPATN